MVTAMALALGIVLGILGAMVRTAHDQQRPGNRNPILGVMDAVCRGDFTAASTYLQGQPDLGVTTMSR